MKHLVITSTLFLTACSGATASCDREFGKQVAEALSSGDVDKVLDMYHLEGVDDQTLNIVRHLLQDSAGKEVEAIEIVALPEDFPLEYKMGGNKYEMNLAPDKQLKLQFVEKTGTQEGLLHTGMGLPLGMYDGQCRIASAAKVSG